MQRIYLDHNATTPPHPAVIAEMADCLAAAFGNPSSLHWAGQGAQRRLDRARQQVAALIGAPPDEIVFTSGATEANNTVLKGLAHDWRGRGGHIVTTAIEHQAVLNPCRHLEACGVRVTCLPVTRDGVVNPAAVAAALAPDTFLVSVMLANNDTGVIQPVRDIAALAHARGVPVHTDATQAVGKMPVDVRALGVDFLSLSAHKFNGPKGAGALFIRPAPGRGLEPLLHGGHQERRRRAGTENLPAIAGFGRACDLAAAGLPHAPAEIAILRDRLETGILEHFPDAVVNGRGAPRLPTTANIAFPGVNGMHLMMNLDLHGIAVSTGSACSAGEDSPSHVLQAMGRSDAEARSSVRFSLGPGTTAAEIDATLDVLATLIPKLRKPA